jgi:hypothetical protein
MYNPENEDSASEWLWRQFKSMNRQPTSDQEEMFGHMLAFHRLNTDESTARSLAFDCINE